MTLSCPRRRSSGRRAEGRLSLLQDPANKAIPGDGTFHAVNGLVSSGPSDSWLTPDDQYFHQIFGNASVLISYRLDKASGKLTEIGRTPLPYNSPRSEEHTTELQSQMRTPYAVF